MSIININEWHQRARRCPTDKDFNVQLGCHFEEIAEMVETLKFHVDGFPTTAGANTALLSGLKMIADRLKSGECTATIEDREGFLDAIADQVVTGIGTAYCAGMDVVEAIKRVDTSNWSKYVAGRPQFDANGKITKGPDYKKPNLEGCY